MAVPFSRLAASRWTTEETEYVLLKKRLNFVETSEEGHCQITYKFRNNVDYSGEVECNIGIVDIAYYLRYKRNEMILTSTTDTRTILPPSPRMASLLKASTSSEDFDEKASFCGHQKSANIGTGPKRGRWVLDDIEC